VPTIFSSSFSEVDAIAGLPSRYFQLDIAIMEQDRRACNDWRETQRRLGGDTALRQSRRLGDVPRGVRQA